MDGAGDPAGVGHDGVPIHGAVGVDGPGPDTVGRDQWIHRPGA